MKSAVFDLDGTLVDSIDGIEYSARTAAGRVLPGLLVPELRPIIGPPIAEMFARIWPALDPAKIRLLTAEFRAHYDDSGCLLSKPYPGVLPTLANLHEAGWRLFVLTNKPSAPTGRILKSLGLLPYLEAAYSPDSLSPPTTSKPEGARLMMRRHGLDPLFTTLVGDGKDDKASAATCGWRFIAAGYGYGGVSAPQRVEKFSDIADLLL